MRASTIFSIISTVLFVHVSGMDNGLAALPPMGWRSWNCFSADINDAKIEISKGYSNEDK